MIGHVSRLYIDSSSVAWRAKMENEWKCKQCTKTFTKKRSLTRYIKGIHEEQKLHKWEICQKHFSRKKNKELHVNTCTRRINQGTSRERTYKTVNDLKFNIVLRKSAFRGCFADWIIVYPEDYYFIEPCRIRNETCLHLLCF